MERATQGESCRRRQFGDGLMVGRWIEMHGAIKNFGPYRRGCISPSRSRRAKATLSIRPSV